MKLVRLHKAAESEYLKSVKYYERQQKGLGSDFIAAFDDAWSRLAEDPGVGQHTGLRDYRSLQLHQFPYRLVYAERMDIIWIVAVAHGSRRPWYWQNRRIKN